MQLSVTPLRDQITAPARTILLVLLAAAGVVFVIACSNVANLILARSVRREGELAVRAALGASRGALRRTLLAESLVLCGAGAVLGVLLARPFVAVVAQLRRALLGARARRHASMPRVLWVGAGLAIAAAVLLAYVPRLPSPYGADRFRARQRQRADHAGHQSSAARLRDDADRLLVRAARRRRHAARGAHRAADGQHRLTTRGRCWRSTFRRCRSAPAMAARRRAAIAPHFCHRTGPVSRGRIAAAAGRRAVSPSATSCPGATPAHWPPHPVRRRRLHAGRRRREPARAAAQRRTRFLRDARHPGRRRPRVHRGRSRAAASAS